MDQSKDISHSLPGDVGMREALAVKMVSHDEMAEHPASILARAALTPSPCPGDGMREALTFIDRFFEPWGSWKTVWWEGEVSDDAAFSADNALKHVANKLRAALTPSELPPEHCQRCGHNNPSWSAPSPLWNAVIRGGSIDGDPMFSDMVCAACFMELAEQQGIASDWTVKARNVAVPLETTTPSGRVWNDDKGLWASALSGDAGEGE